MTKLKIELFRTFKNSSLVGVLLTLPVINQCEFFYEESEVYQVFFYLILAFSGVLLVLQFFVYSIDFLILIFRKLQGKQIEIMEIFCYTTIIIVGFIWRFIRLKISNDGKCDTFFWPLDTGLVLALIIATGINYWKLKIINGQKFNKKSNLILKI